MTDDLIPPDLQQFILQNIDSIAQMEGLLLLRADRDREWTAESIAQRLYTTRHAGELLLAHLFAIGMLARPEEHSPPRYKYRPATPELEQMVERLVDVYARCLLPVTHLIHSKQKNRIQEFADAFLIRKE